MSLFSRIAGVVASVFSIGGPTGPTLTAASGRLTASGNVAGSNPVAAQDFVTLTYGNANYGGGSTPATINTLGTVYLGAYCYNAIPSGQTVSVPAGETLLQVGSLDIEGTLDLSSGDIFWVG